MKETFFDLYLRKARIKKLLPYISRYKDCKLLDIGCGWEGRFLNDIAGEITFGVGIDKKAPLESPNANIKFYRGDLADGLDFIDTKFNIVTMMAVLEHLNNPGLILSQIKNLLLPDGLLIGTVPSTYAKPVLEFLSYKLHLIDKEEILDHKDYYVKEKIEKLFSENSLTLAKHKYFQFGMNNFFIGELKNKINGV